MFSSYLLWNLTDSDNICYLVSWKNLPLAFSSWYEEGLYNTLQKIKGMTFLWTTLYKKTTGQQCCELQLGKTTTPVCLCSTHGRERNRLLRALYWIVDEKKTLRWPHIGISIESIERYWADGMHRLKSKIRPSCMFIGVCRRVLRWVVYRKSGIYLRRKRRRSSSVVCWSTDGRFARPSAGSACRSVRCGSTRWSGAW